MGAGVMEAKMSRERQHYKDLKDQYTVVSRQHTSLQSTVRRTHKAIVDKQDGKHGDSEFTMLNRHHLQQQDVGEEGSGEEDTPPSLERVAENMYNTVQRYMEIEKRRVDLHKAINQCRRRVRSLTNKHSKLVAQA